MKKLFLIDDDPLDRMLMKLAIEKINDNFEVVELGSAKEAVQSILKERPLATLVDMRMPEVDGISLLKTMRDISELRTHMVFMISGSAEPADYALALENGANNYFTKPSSLSGYQDLAKDILTHII